MPLRRTVPRRSVTGLRVAFRGAVEVADERDTAFLESVASFDRDSAAEVGTSLRIRHDGRGAPRCGAMG